VGNPALHIQIGICLHGHSEITLDMRPPCCPESETGVMQDAPGTPREGGPTSPRAPSQLDGRSTHTSGLDAESSDVILVAEESDLKEYAASNTVPERVTRDAWVRAYQKSGPYRHRSVSLMHSPQEDLHHCLSPRNASSIDIASLVSRFAPPAVRLPPSSFPSRESVAHRSSSTWHVIIQSAVGQGQHTSHMPIRMFFMIHPVGMEFVSPMLSSPCSCTP
jgi:hypothetical protein